MSKVMRTHTGITEWNGDFYCDVCGRRVKGITTMNGMDFCAKCYQDTFGNEEISLLKQQLADKDKEIERLKYRILYSQLQAPKEEIEKFNMLMSYKSLNYETQLRHQVCEEIREKFDKLCEVQDNLDYICTYGFEEILDQIEKGEKNDKT